jgi:tetratricopeptide (TPR) repeat protein
VLAAAGVVRFHEQRYAEAVSLLEKAEEGRRGAAGELLPLARATRDVTRDYASQESEHFRVSYPKGKDEVLAPYVLEALEAQRRALQKDLGFAPAGKVAVELLNDTRDLARLSTLTEEEIKTSGTIAICKFNKLMVVSPKALLTGYDWLDTAAHEYVHHVLIQRTRDRTPVWLQEGISKYEEARWRGSAGAELSPYSAAVLRDAAKHDGLITFREMHPSMAKLPSQEAVSLAFAEVATMVEYLEKKGGAPLMNRILDRIVAGRGAEDAVAEAMGVPFPKVLDDWKKQIAIRPLPEGGERVLRRLRFKGDPKHGGSYSEWSEVSDDKAQEFARLGEIMRERGKWDAARIEYGKAIERVGTRIPMLSNKYGLAAMMSGQEDAAEAALAAASKAHPGYAALHVQLGRLYVKRQLWDRARRELLLANRTDPFDPEIHAGLATALERLGDADGASRERHFASILLERQGVSPSSDTTGK